MNKSNKLIYVILCIGLLFVHCAEDDKEPGDFYLESAFVGSVRLSLEGVITENVPTDKPITLIFASIPDEDLLEEAIILSEDEEIIDASYNLNEANRSVQVSVLGGFKNFTTYKLSISNQLKSVSGLAIDATDITFRTSAKELEIDMITFNEKEINTAQRISNIPVNPQINIAFSTSVDPESIANSVTIAGIDITVALEGDNTISVTALESLSYLEKYQLRISSAVKSIAGDNFEGTTIDFYTHLDSTFKFPEITDEELLTKVQQQTFKYFWDFGHPVSGLTRERNTSGETVTSGGSGFGVMAIIVGIERGFITRQEGIDRLETIVDFLGTADRFHGAWSHWLNGTTGDVIPFSNDDDGGDLVETAFMIQGLLAAREYLNDANSQEAEMIDKINTLWEGVEWDWYTQDGQDVLYWHWSPNFGWQKNHQIAGWNEALIIYVLAASSPTHTIDPDVYTKGWSRDGTMANSSGNSYYGYTLDLRADRGGPLFFSHYSFLGLDPRNLEDQFANYWDQNVNHSLINQAYCEDNPQNYVGYSSASWGLTASDNHEGYSAHSPDNDRGVITPTAAISSIPYTSEKSMDALRHFYYIMGDKLWGEYGFYDAFNPTESWYASSYLAIDQGPIICMIENHRTGLLWDLFMSAPEVQAGLDKLGFTY